MIDIRKYFIFICISNLIFVFSFGQAVDLKKLEQGPGYLFINGFAEKLQCSSLISFDSVLKPTSQKRFQSLPDKPVIFNGYDPWYYWMRVSLINTDTVAKEVLLLFGGKGVRSAELWQSVGDGWRSLGKTGYKYPFDSRSYAFTHYNYRILVPPQTTSFFYLNIDESHAYKVFTLSLFQPRMMDRFKNRFYYFFGFFTGVLLLFAIFNFYLFFSIRERIHVWYSLYILSAIAFVVKDYGIDSEFFGLDSELGYRLTSMGGIASVGWGFMVQVVQIYLTNISRKSFLYHILSIIKWSLWLSGAAYFFVFFVQPVNTIEVLIFEWSNKSVTIASMLVLIACIYSVWNGYKAAWILLAGWMVFLTGSLLRSIFALSVTQVIPPAPFQIGLLLEVFIISFGLMYRYNLFKKEKEQLALQLNEQELNLSTQIVATQEIERKRIAEDLHDELGGNLAAIKMAVQSFNLLPEQVEMMKQLIDKASTSARNIAHNLMPPDFEKTSFIDLLKNYYQRINTEGSIRFYFYSSGPVTIYDKQTELMIYRIIMELTNNIYKHSRASEATIQIMYHEDHLELMVEDNGEGISESTADGIGLKNIRSRVNYLNGRMNIDSNKRGTTVIIWIPYKKEQG